MKKILLPVMAACAVAASPQAYVGMFDSNSQERGARTIQYHPDAEGFIVAHNGKNLYTRALYGGNTVFRMETGDMPIFAAFHGKDNRNVHFIVDTKGGALRLDSVADCTAKYRGGERRYELSDPSWEGGRLTVTLLAPRSSESGIWKVEAEGMPKDARLTAVSCATVPVKLNRNGDMGADPANALAPDPELRNASTCSVPVGGKRRTVYVRYADRAVAASPQRELEREYASAAQALDSLTSQLRIETPDPYLNVLGPVITHAADGNYDGKVWLHGAIGWRMPLSGWRGAYMADFLGWHDRGRSHFDAYALSQVKDVEPVRPHPTQDPEKNMARALKEWGTQMYSNGYICRNPGRNNQMHHYDMNLCYVDELLWHLMWTGDLEYARKMWPLLKSHLAWEKRNFDPDGDNLYDAYCCIWASDALYYNSGAVTHSSAYNCRANRIAAVIAEKIGEDPAPYRAEADRIQAALDSVLWMPAQGVWAEFRDFMGHRRLHDHPALWTVYHAIDSDVADPLQAYSATRYVDNNIPHIPVAASSEKEAEGYATVATTDWLPYAWSINNVAFAEVYHTALAFWQAGRPDAATHLLKSALLDGMYLGRSPGNIGQISHCDAARGECYRDFADPVAMLTRAVVQGLFGFSPDLLDGKVDVRPGFPSEWDSASITHPDFSLSFLRQGRKDLYSLQLDMAAPDSVRFALRAPCDRVDGVKVNGQPAPWHVAEGCVGVPSIVVEVPYAPSLTVEVEWGGNALRDIAGKPTGIERRGFREVASGDMHWWEEISAFRHAEPDAALLGLDLMAATDNRYEPVNLGAHYNANVTDIFRNRYLSPRSPYTTLQIPVQGMGEWCHPEDTAHIDDSGLRAAVGADGIVRTSVGIPFASVREGCNAVYTSLFDNYPDSVTVPLTGKARGLELLLAGSTNHMQCHMENARLTARYADGSSAVMPLIAPYNWAPIEQDYYIDGKAFKVDTPRPYRMILADARVTDDVAGTLGITGVYGRRINGGAGVMLCMPLDPGKELESLTLTAVSNDIVAGLLGLTYLR